MCSCLVHLVDSTFATYKKLLIDIGSYPGTASIRTTEKNSPRSWKTGDIRVSRSLHVATMCMKSKLCIEHQNPNPNILKLTKQKKTMIRDDSLLPAFWNRKVSAENRQRLQAYGSPLQTERLRAKHGRIIFSNECVFSIKFNVLDAMHTHQRPLPTSSWVWPMGRWWCPPSSMNPARIKRENMVPDSWFFSSLTVLSPWIHSLG